MKKIILSAALVASGSLLFAQDSLMHNMNNNNPTTTQQMSTTTNQSMNQNTSSQNANLSTTSNYNAYGIPNYVQMNFQSQNPNVSNLTWTAPTADWYHGYYSDANGRYTHVYYSTDPYYNVQYYPERVVGYRVALPVLQTWVPDAVVTTATNLYKQNLYDIAAMKGNNNTEMYVVRVLDNGELKSMYMDNGGTAVTDFIRIEEQPITTDINSSMSTDSNAAMDNNNSLNTNTDVKTKTKTEMSDGTQIKTKTKNGKTKTKVSGSTNNNNQL